MLIAVVVCVVFWSFSLGTVVNPGHCVVLAGVYGLPSKKFLICIVPHIICIQVTLLVLRAALVNCEIFSSDAGFFSYASLMSCSHNHNSILHLAERLKFMAFGLLINYSRNHLFCIKKTAFGLYIHAIFTKILYSYGEITVFL